MEGGGGGGGFTQATASTPMSEKFKTLLMLILTELISYQGFFEDGKTKQGRFTEIARLSKLNFRDFLNATNIVTKLETDADNLKLGDELKKLKRANTPMVDIFYKMLSLPVFIDTCELPQLERTYFLDLIKEIGISLQKAASEGGGAPIAERLPRLPFFTGRRQGLSPLPFPKLPFSGGGALITEPRLTTGRLSALQIPHLSLGGGAAYSDQLLQIVGGIIHDRVDKEKTSEQRIIILESILEMTFRQFIDFAKQEGISTDKLDQLQQEVKQLQQLKVSVKSILCRIIEKLNDLIQTTSRTNVQVKQKFKKLQEFLMELIKHRPLSTADLNTPQQLYSLICDDGGRGSAAPPASMFPKLPLSSLLNRGSGGGGGGGFTQVTDSTTITQPLLILILAELINHPFSTQRTEKQRVEEIAKISRLTFPEFLEDEDEKKERRHFNLADSQQLRKLRLGDELEKLIRDRRSMRDIFSQILTCADFIKSSKLQQEKKEGYINFIKDIEQGLKVQSESGGLYESPYPKPRTTRSRFSFASPVAPATSKQSSPVVQHLRSGGKSPLAGILPKFPLSLFNGGTGSSSQIFPTGPSGTLRGLPLPKLRRSIGLHSAGDGEDKKQEGLMCLAGALFKYISAKKRTEEQMKTQMTQILELTFPEFLRRIKGQVNIQAPFFTQKQGVVEKLKQRNTSMREILTELKHFSQDRRVSPDSNYRLLLQRVKYFLSLVPLDRSVPVSGKEKATTKSRSSSHLSDLQKLFDVSTIQQLNVQQLLPEILRKIKEDGRQDSMHDSMQDSMQDSVQDVGLQYVRKLVVLVKKMESQEIRFNPALTITLLLYINVILNKEPFNIIQKGLPPKQKEMYVRFKESIIKFLSSFLKSILTTPDKDEVNPLLHIFLFMKEFKRKREFSELETIYIIWNYFITIMHVIGKERQNFSDITLFFSLLSKLTTRGQFIGFKKIGNDYFADLLQDEIIQGKQKKQKPSISRQPSGGEGGLVVRRSDDSDDSQEVIKQDFLWQKINTLFMTTSNILSFLNYTDGIKDLVYIMFIVYLMETYKDARIPIYHEFNRDFRKQFLPQLGSEYSKFVLSKFYMFLQKVIEKYPTSKQDIDQFITHLLSNCKISKTNLTKYIAINRKALERNFHSKYRKGQQQIQTEQEEKRVVSSVKDSRIQRLKNRYLKDPIF